MTSPNDPLSVHSNTSACAVVIMMRFNTLQIKIRDLSKQKTQRLSLAKVSCPDHETLSLHCLLFGQSRLA